MKEIRGYNKFDMLYPDRCMLKWKPMLLSEHGEKLLDYNLKSGENVDESKKGDSESHKKKAFSYE